MKENWIAPKQPVWLLKNGSFIKAVMESLNNEIAICLLEDGNYAQAKKHLIFQRNPAYKEFSPDRWDLMDTDVLNEPQMLKTLKFRLQNSRIYTFVQNSIISVNPYMPIHALNLDQLKDFYIQNIIKAEQSMREFEPHIYSITSHMICSLHKTNSDQAVIISGESGAGKTEANKECLRFLQYYFHRSNSTVDKNIDNILSLSNPILQAFGNAKTIRNNNSSRFGKYLNISVNNKLEIKQVKIFNYLLEKSRIISRAENQQNFHIFYELLRGLSKSQKSKYFLCNSQEKDYKMQDFKYLRAKAITKYDQHPSISFQKVKESLITLQKEDAYDFACRVLSATLLLGNLIPFQSQNEDCCKISNEQILVNICQLLKIKQQILTNALTCYQIKIGSQILTKYFNARQVQQLINSFAKVLYERLFQWIINQINSISQYQAEEKMVNLGFLDIYGFQILEQNSLEQLFINYTNERLHQIYLNKIFKEQESLFKLEGLSHKFQTIPFEDNVLVLQLIDYQQLSILNLLDEWCSVASPDDSSFITKLRHKHKKHPKFPMANFNLPSTMFLIRHSPKDIEYTVIGFRDKNRDLLRDQIKTAVRSSEIEHLASLFTQNNQLSEKNMTNHKYRKFLSSKFRHQISNLVTNLIGKSNLHFIRCVKSNNSQQPISMDDEVVFNQICHLGILDTIKLKKIGYSIKLSYQTIDKRFKWLVRYYYTLEAFPKEIMQAINQFLPRYTEEDILFGTSKIFFKDYAYSNLAKQYTLYLQKLNNKCKLIQKHIGSFKFHRKLARFKKGGKIIKAYLKTMLASKHFNKVEKGLLIIQKNIKKKLQLIRKGKRLKNILILQSYIKKQVCRNKKQKVFLALQKIICLIKRYQLKKNIQKYAIINQLKDLVINKAWKKIVIFHKNIIQNYLRGFLIQAEQKKHIGLANYNTQKKFQQKYTKGIQKYLLSFHYSLRHHKLMETIKYTQRVFRSWIYRQKFLKLKKAAIIIQRAYRQYYFNKNTAREIFDINFGQYQHALNSQNTTICSVLYHNQLQNSLRLLYKHYLDKFRQKCSIFYIIVDFHALINLDLCYPNNSWLLNYFQVVKETLDKDNPIQSLQVGQTFTAAASTNRVYLWGMNNEYKTYENVVIIKPQGTNRFEKIQIVNNSLEITYEDNRPDNRPDKLPKTYSTISKQYTIQNGKLFEVRVSSLRLIKLPQTNQLIAQVSCGANHTIFRTSTRKVYTFGSGKHGQLGHGGLHSSEQPKWLQFSQLKNYHPIQVSASFNSSIILLSNRKLYWCGSNGTIDKVKSPILFDLNRTFQQLGNGMFTPLKIISSWTRSISIIGITFLHFNGILSNNIGLRNKVYEVLVAKWREHDIDTINPPFNPSYTDYLEECHVKMPRTTISIEPESKRTLKKLQQKIGSTQADKLNNFSFSEHMFK